MSILVTGGCGYIGSHMTWNLHDAGKDVVIIDNLSTGFPWLVPDDVPVIEGDIGDSDLVAKVMAEHNVDAVIHFAGSIVVPESVTDPLAYYFNNTVKSRSLIENAVKAKVKAFFFSSTAAVYGYPEGDPDLMTEDIALKPISPYGSSKLMTEQMLRDSAHAYGLQFAALRYFNVAGADPQGRTGQSTPAATHLIKVANQVALGQRSELSVFGDDYPTPDGTCIRDYIHVSDLVAAHALALEALQEGHDPFIANCGYGQGFSVLEVVEAVRKASNNPFEARITERRDGDPAKLVADSSRLRAITGWQPQYQDLDLIVDTALKWEEYLIDKGHNRS